MLHLLLLLHSITFAAFVPPPRRVCEQILLRKNCWGPAASAYNVCVWDAADGLCAEESEDDVEATCVQFMMESSCRARKYCAWNTNDMKCESHETTTEFYEQEDHFSKTCEGLTQTLCVGYAGAGTECGWNPTDLSCTKGYPGDFAFHCMQHHADNCDDNGACMVSDGKCVSRESHPAGIPEAPSGLDMTENEGRTLMSPHQTSSDNSENVIQVPIILLGGILGFLSGVVLSLVCCRGKTSSTRPIPLIEHV